MYKTAIITAHTLFDNSWVYFFVIQENTSYSTLLFRKIQVFSHLEKSTFYHSEVWAKLTASILKHLEQVITSFIAKDPCTHLH